MKNILLLMVLVSFFTCSASTSALAEGFSKTKRLEIERVLWQYMQKKTSDGNIWNEIVGITPYHRSSGGSGFDAIVHVRHCETPTEKSMLEFIIDVYVHVNGNDSYVTLDKAGPITVSNVQGG